MQYFFIGAMTLLQAAAPLLHAHLELDYASPPGVHMHLDVHLAADQAAHMTAANATQADSAAIGIGQEMRRDLIWDADTFVCVALVLCLPGLRPTPSPRPVDLASRLPASPFFLTPPPQGPPIATV